MSVITPKISPQRPPNCDIRAVLYSSDVIKMNSVDKEGWLMTHQPTSGGKADASVAPIIVRSTPCRIEKLLILFKFFLKRNVPTIQKMG